MRKRHFIAILLQLVFICRNFAVPAYPSKVVVKTENGKDVAIYMQGDENRKYALTSDGFTLLSNEVGWWYAEENGKGEIIKSSFMLMSEEDETADLKAFKATCPKGLVPKNIVSFSNRAPRDQKTQANTPIIGERRALVILMQFQDVPFKKSNEDFHSLFNAINYHGDNVTGSVRDYYRFASQGQLDYLSDIYGPYTANNTMSYYGRNASTGGSDAHAVDLCIEAMKHLPDTINFSHYDNDKDGLIDNVHIIYAGYGEEAGGPSYAIWAHEYPHRINLQSAIGYSLAGYSCSPELRSNYGSEISHIGVVCHELGHALGAMDYYDTNYGTGGEYDGTGKWDIMASGSWNDNGRTPPNFNPYVRSTIFGWNKQEVLVPEKNYSMSQMKVENASQTKVYRLETGSEGDYFLLENRQKRGFDAALPGEGLMIYHVHPFIDRYRATNTINASHPQAMYPVCAAGSNPTSKEYGNINSTDCPFPGSHNVSVFSPSTRPAALAWNGSSAKVSISSIAMQSTDGSVTFTTGEGSGDIGPDDGDSEQPTNKKLVYFEGFENNIDKKMSATSIIGNSLWCTYRVGDIATNTEYIPSPSNGNGLLMLIAGKESPMSESEIVSQYIEVQAGTNYYISFDICTKILAGVIPPSFKLYIEDKYGEHRLYSVESKVYEWSHVELPVIFADNSFRYKLYGRINTSGIFIDNFSLYGEIIDSSILSLTKEQGSQRAKVYTLKGEFLGYYSDLKSILNNGIYILRQGTHFRKISNIHK